MRFSMRPDRVYDGYEQIRGEELARRGIRLLLCDLDYTLAPKSQWEPDETVRQWIDSLRRAGVEVMILSNNRSPARVERFCRDLGITYEGHAQKPSAKGFRRAMARVGVTPEETAMLGEASAPSWVTGAEYWVSSTTSWTPGILAISSTFP